MAPEPPYCGGEWVRVDLNVGQIVKQNNEEEYRRPRKTLPLETKKKISLI
jgi:hypothetical protein